MSSWPAGIGRETLATVDSTNAEALRRLATGQQVPPGWILALEQTGGRGRRGRSWVGAEGNFYASCISYPTGGPAGAALRSFTAALGLHDALTALTGRTELFSLKWPNDVLLSGRKLAGILLETHGSGQGASVPLVTGIGVNLVTAPSAAHVEPGAVTPVSLMEATGLRIEPEEFLDHLGPAMHYWDQRLGLQGFEPVRAAWLASAARLGQQVVARLPGREVSGQFESIDPSGSIVLGTDLGRVALPAAEIFFAERD